MAFKNIFDSHAHYDDEVYDADRDELLANLPKLGVEGIVNCSSNPQNAEITFALAQKYNYIYAAIGCHPHDTHTMTDEILSRFEQLARGKKVVAIGEIGLDYYYDNTDRDVQKLWFEKQLALAKKLDLPVVIHDREAHQDTLVLLKKHKPRGVVHCFSGGTELASEVLKLDMFIGLGGTVTFKNAKKPVEVAAFVPQNRLLIETDAPYLSPVPFRGQRNSSEHIPLIAQAIAAARGKTAQEVLDFTMQNAKELFNI
jgi:TatD DNase family protein